jgi:protoheme ferro-lyase
MSHALPPVDAVLLLSFGGPEGPDDAWALVFQSRSGPPTQPRLEPDVCDHLRALRDAGVAGAVVVPIGFVADHMEVKYALDTQARGVANEIGLEMERALAVGAAPTFVAGLRQLLASTSRGAAHRLSAREGHGRFRAHLAAAPTHRNGRRRGEPGHAPPSM